MAEKQSAVEKAAEECVLAYRNLRHTWRSDDNVTWKKSEFGPIPT